MTCVQGAILSVDDDAETRELIAFTLHQYRICVASTLAEGLRCIERESFDLYLLDTWLPDGDGIELCRAIRDVDPNVPVVFVSAVAIPSIRLAALQAGASAYLIKPVDFDELARRVMGLVADARSRSRDAVAEELRAMRENLEPRYESAIQRGRLATAAAELAQQRLKDSVFRAFAARGGSRADFERMWPGVAAGRLAMRALVAAPK